MDSYNYYFFDLDGTISESAPGIVKAVKYGLDQAGIHEEDAEKHHSFIGPPLNVQMKKLYGMTDEQIVTAVTAFRKLYEDEGGLYDCEAYDGIGDLLYDLKKEGKVLAVASSKPEPFVRKIIDRFGFTDAFDVICGSGIGDELTKKASRSQKAEIIHKAMGQLSGNGNAERLAGRTVMIGDTNYDILGAKANSLPSVGVAYGYGSRQELEEAGAEKVADTVEDLRKLLLRGER